MPIHIITAFTAKTFGIGRDGALPWCIPADLKHFSKVTSGGVVVMGRKTWESLPCPPLKNRLNIVVTSTPWESQDENVISTTMDGLDGYSGSNIFIIGGAAMYASFLGKADKIHATVIENDIECDTFFPRKGFDSYEIEECGEVTEYNDYKYRFVTYRLADKAIHDEYAYLDLMKRIIESGNEREDRTGTGTFSLFGPQLSFDISKSIPLLTTKFVGYKTILKELLFFLRGDTDSRILEEQGVGIWKANTTRAFLDKRGLHDYREGLMGPMYGCNWRHFGGAYDPVKGGSEGGFDQIKALLEGLQNDPYSRRHMITTFDPSTVVKCVLAPCHGIIAQFYVEGGSLSCQVYCRSSDMFLGLPFNIASYAMLTYIIGKKSNLQPKHLILTMGDAHVYKNHVEQALLQVSREPLPFPIFTVGDAVKDKAFEDLDVSDFSLEGYLHHPAIKAPMAV